MIWAGMQLRNNIWIEFLKPKILFDFFYRGIVCGAK